MRFVVFRDVSFQYRWHFVAPNGRIVAVSGEGYLNRSDCLAAIELVKAYSSAARVEDPTTAGSPARY